MNDAGIGRDFRTFDMCLKPRIDKECAKGLYGKFALIQDEVKNVSDLALGVLGAGAVRKVPSRSLDSE